MSKCCRTYSALLYIWSIAPSEEKQIAYGGLPSANRWAPGNPPYTTPLVPSNFAERCGQRSLQVCTNQLTINCKLCIVNCALIAKKSTFRRRCLNLLFYFTLLMSSSKSLIIASAVRLPVATSSRLLFEGSRSAI